MTKLEFLSFSQQYELSASLQCLSLSIAQCIYVEPCIINKTKINDFERRLVKSGDEAIAIAKVSIRSAAANGQG